MSSNFNQRTVTLQMPEIAPIDIEFKDITYTVSLGFRKGKKEILRGVSGKFQSGELTAIMGPSGAGKSSLLNILTGFQTTGMGGTITTNNSTETGSAQYRKECCYILQDDNLCPLFTVQEAMNMAADLKLGDSISAKAKQFLINDILENLGLLDHTDTRCQRLSGGQKKRLSVALELIDNPPIMFLDEPTTGLDSSSSSQCIKLLKELARGGRTIVCTIHQPSASIYELFDHVYVVAEGQCIYQGASLNTVSYLSSVGFHCPQYHNPADYLLEVANGDYGNFTKELSKAANASPGCWRSVRTIPMLDNNSSVISNSTNNETPSKKQGTADEDTTQKALVLVNTPSEFSRFKVLLTRGFLQMHRDWTVSHLRLLLHVAVGILLGLKYLHSGYDGSKTYRNIGFLIISAVYLCYTSMMPAILRFPSELPVLRKERFNNWYCLKTYYMAAIVVNTPIQALFCLFYTSVSYVMSDQPLDLFRYAMFLCACIMVAITAETIGLLFGTLVNPINGTFLGAIYTALMLVLAGFLALFSHMPKVFHYLSYISFLKYTLEACVAALYGYGREPLICPDDEIYCHYKSPEILLEEFTMQNPSFWSNIAIVGAYFLVLRVAVYFSLCHRLKNN